MFIQSEVFTKEALIMRCVLSVISGKWQDDSKKCIKLIKKGIKNTKEGLENLIKDFNQKKPINPIKGHNGENLEKAAKILEEYKCRFIINQNRYSIFDRTIENNGLKETAEKLEKGIIAFSPLAQGLLTDRYLNGIPEDSRVRTDGRFLNEGLITAEKLEKVRALNEIAKERGQTLAEMALSWVLKDGVVTSVLIGASKSSQILDNIKALENTSFSTEELSKINENSAL